MTTPRSFSIVIPTFNRARRLAQTLETLRQLQPSPQISLEILIINNRCTDPTSEVVRRFAASSPWPAREIREERQGLCFCRNRGLHESRGQYVIFLDDDVDVAPEWLAGATDAVKQFDPHALTGPVEPNYEIPPPPFIAPAVLASLTATYSLKGESPHLIESSRAHELPGCNFCAHREYALKIGGFDTRLDRVGRKLLSGGDWEFGMRVATSGGRVAYHPKCRVRHFISATRLTTQYLRNRWFYDGYSRGVITQLHDGTPHLRQRVKVIRRSAGLFLRALRFGMSAPRATAFQAYLEFLRQWGMTLALWQGIPAS